MVSSAGLSPGAWLDIGAGRGFLLDAAKAAGWATAAVESDPGGVKQLSCSGHIVYPVLGSVTSSWDVISLSHFVEHVIDPVGLMQAVRGLLNPGGVVCFEVPNCGNFQQPSTHDDPHTLFFSERGVKHCFARAGLQILSVGAVSGDHLLDRQPSQAGCVPRPAGLDGAALGNGPSPIYILRSGPRRMVSGCGRLEQRLSNDLDDGGQRFGRYSLSGMDPSPATIGQSNQDVTGPRWI